MAKRKVCEIIQYDYSTESEMENHIKEMKEKGFHLIDGEFGISEIKGEIYGQDEKPKWKYTAMFIRRNLFIIPNC